MDFFDIGTIAFSVADYPVSYVELIATGSGLVSVYLASRANIWTWPTGIVNIFFLFLLFYQVQLYADMVLQVFYLVVTIFGWYNWSRAKNDKSIAKIKRRARIIYLIITVCFTALAGFAFSKIHLWLPGYFKMPAAYPYVDSFIMAASVIATILLAQKKVENWYYWIVVDTICVILYSIKDIYVLAVAYVIFLVLSSYGLYNWRKQVAHG